MSKVLVVYYSYTGNSRRLAQALAAYQQWPVAEITEREPRSGAWGTVRCVLDSLLARRPAIAYPGPDPAGFDLIVLVAPIWAYQLAGPMRTFVSDPQNVPQRFAILCTMGGSGAPNAFSEVAGRLGKAPVLDAAFTAREIEDGSAMARLRGIGEALQAAVGRDAPVRPFTWSPQTH